MTFVDYYDYRDKDLSTWHACPMRPPLLVDMFNERIDWLSDRPGQRFFLQPMAGAFWFESKDDALLYRLHWG